MTNDQQQEQQQPVGSGLIAFEGSRLPITPKFAEKLGVTAGEWRVLVDQLFPAARTVEAVTMALSYCHARKLDIYKKPVHIVPMYSSALKRMVETVWPSIAEIRTTAARTKEYAGIDEVVFGPEKTEKFTGEIETWEDRKKIVKTVTKEITYPQWASVVVYRIVQGQRFAFHTKIFWKETYAKMGKTKLPNDMWENRTYSQFDKCLEAAALRKAFPEEVGSMYAAEEMEGREIETATPEQSAKATARTAAPPNPDDDEADATMDALRDAGKDVEDAVIDDDGAPDPGSDEDNGAGRQSETVETEKQVEDAEFNEIEDYFANLMDALDAAEDEASVEEVYSNADPLARFEGQQMLQVRAQNLRSRRLIQINKKKKK